ncbi:hypothetical protein V6N13_148534 [Hibiscus sabdariffa]
MSGAMPRLCTSENLGGGDKCMHRGMTAFEQQVFLSAKHAWTDKRVEVADVVVWYFGTLFTSSHPEPSSTLLDLITPSVDSVMNDTLLLPFTDDEILSSFQDIDPGKAPGIDGLPGSFYRQNWDI